MACFSNGTGFCYGYSFGPNYLKTWILKSGYFCLDFKWLVTNGQPFVWNLNGQVSGFQILAVLTGGSYGALWVLQLFFDCWGLIRVWGDYKGILLVVSTVGFGILFSHFSTVECISTL